MGCRCRSCLILVGFLIAAAIAFSCSEKPSAPDSPLRQPSWSTITSPTSCDLNDAWGASDDCIFAVGNSGTILRFNGIEWDTMTNTTWNDFQGVWGSSKNSVFAVGSANPSAVYYNGIKWIALGDLDFLSSVWGSSGNAVYAVGANGGVMSYNGTVWNHTTAPVPLDLYGVWGSAENNVFMVGELGLILNYSGTGWNLMSSEVSQHILPVDAATVSYYDLSNTYELQDNCLVHGSQLESNFLFEFDVRELSLVGAAAITSAEIDIEYARAPEFGLCSNDLPLYYYLNTANGVIEVGEMYSGTLCSEKIPCTSALNGIVHVNVLDALRAAVSGSKDYIGFRIEASDYHGLTFPSCPPSMTVSTQPCLNSIWGSSNNNVYAVGTTGTILHYDGQSWTKMDSGTIYDLNDIWGISAGDIFAVGANGKIIHYDGHAWTGMDSGTTKNLNAVWGMWPTNVYVFGEDGLILRYN